MNPNDPILPVSAPMRQPGAQQGVQPQGPQSNLKYTIAGPDGKPAFIGEQAILRTLGQQGYQITGLSPDGMTVNFAGGNSVAIPDIIGKMGYTVQGMEPRNVNYENVSPLLRGVIGLPGLNDEDKKQLLRSRLARSGVENPLVEGKGENFHVFNPMTNQWDALTNKPGADMSDIGDVATGIPRFAGSMLGGMGGAALGSAGGPVGTVAGGAAGGAAGGQVGDAVMGGAGALLDDDYAKIMSKKGAGDILSEQAPKMGWDALGGGLGGGVKAVLPGVAKSGVLSSGARVGGQLADAGGSLLEKGGGYLGKASRAAAQGVDGFGEQMAAGGLAGHMFGPAAFAGDLMKLPGQVIGGIPRAASWIGKQLGRVAPQAGKAMESWGGKFAGAEGGADVLRRAVSNAAEEGAQHYAPGAFREGARQVAQQGAEETYSPLIRGIEGLNDLGNKVNRGIYGATGLAGSSAEALGKAVGGAGRGATKLGGALGKYETGAELQSLKYYLEQKRKAERKRALQAASSGSNMEPTLASTY